MRHALFALLCVLGLTSCAATSVDPTLSQLLDNIERRLSIATTVALHKWDLRQPVQATEREQAIIAAVRLAAPEHQLSPERAAAFFADQIQASKLVQYVLLSQWRLAGRAPDLPRHDLRNNLRPRLDRLQADLLQDLARFTQGRPANCAEQVAHALTQRNDDTLHYMAMIRATGQLCE